jgi:hypothetical protein
MFEVPSSPAARYGEESDKSCEDLDCRRTKRALLAEFSQEIGARSDLNFIRKEASMLAGLKGDKMPNMSITDQLSSLPSMHKEALARLWRGLFETDPPSRMRKELMLQFLAYRMQEQEFGPLSERSHRRLCQVAKAIKDSANTFLLQKIPIRAGTRLIRKWKDQVHIVNVEEDSYEYRGTRYDSLSEIARLITGTRWSGPLFFGLKNKRVENSRVAA